MDVLAIGMAKQTATFIIERTVYGWAVRAEAERLGLFVTQRQALTDVARRRAELQAKGRPTTIVVSGSDPESPSRPFWGR